MKLFLSFRYSNDSLGDLGLFTNAIQQLGLQERETQPYLRQYFTRTDVVEALGELGCGTDLSDDLMDLLTRQGEFHFKRFTPSHGDLQVTIYYSHRNDFPAISTSLLDADPQHPAGFLHLESSDAGILEHARSLFLESMGRRPISPS